MNEPLFLRFWFTIWESVFPIKIFKLKELLSAALGSMLGTDFESVFKKSKLVALTASTWVLSFFTGTASVVGTGSAATDFNGEEGLGAILLISLAWIGFWRTVEFASPLTRLWESTIFGSIAVEFVLLIGSTDSASASVFL